MKTAEEMLREVYSPSEPYGSAVIAMEDFAAQEVAREIGEYKKRLKNLVITRGEAFNSAIKPSDRDQSFDSAMFEIENFIELIDTTK